MNMRSGTMLLWILLVISVGCSQQANNLADISESDEAFVLGDLLEPFNPPSLESLEQSVNAGGGWIDRPVLDSLVLLRERQAKEPILATVNQALDLRNNSDEENAKIQGIFHQPIW